MLDDSKLTDATCQTCGKPMTLREFRACADRAGHFCEAHRPEIQHRKKDIKRRRTEKQPPSDHHGNVAFKVTWVYGEEGPFTSPCTPEGRHLNIKKRRVTWCSQADCPCRKLYDAGNEAAYNREEFKKWPCYDSAVFDKWSFGGGMFHGKSKGGDSIPFKSFRLGKLAFFTSRRHDMREDERIIIGCYRIGKSQHDSDFDMLVAAAGDLRLRVTDLSDAPRYWEFHSQKGEPHWGTGLFRYLPDTEAFAMLAAVEKVAVKID